jgi:hypothetical protein
LIDISYRKIGGRYFDIILDDEGLFKPGGKVTAITTEGEPVHVGNLVICNHDEKGHETGLSDDDIEHLLNCLVVVTERKEKDPMKWLALKDVE